MAMHKPWLNRVTKAIWEALGLVVPSQRDSPAARGGGKRKGGWGGGGLT